jgi:hypothetical protein
VIIDLDRLDKERLPTESAVSVLTMAELAAGPHATSDPVERASRQDRLQRSEAVFKPPEPTAVSMRLWPPRAENRAEHELLIC